MTTAFDSTCMPPLNCLVVHVLATIDNSIKIETAVAVVVVMLVLAVIAFGNGQKGCETKSSINDLEGQPAWSDPSIAGYRLARSARMLKFPLLSL
jgi:hypothetical protein